MSTSTAPSNSTRSTKRLSLNLTSNGPKPLHLLHTTNGNNTDSPAPSGASGSSASSPVAHDSPSASQLGLPSTPLSANGYGKTNGQTRRQSSISYISSSSPSLVRSPAYTGSFSANGNRTSTTNGAESIRVPLARSMSLGGRGGGYRYGPRRDILAGETRRSTGSIQILDADGASISAPSSPAPPLTLAEKHSELLHFIAQKESKCLELRQQLATHEAELLQLKRKWERIIARGFDTATGTPTTMATLPSVPSFNANIPGSVQPPYPVNSPALNGGAVLDGIREGVQGVSRFLSSNLSDFSKNAGGPPSPISPWKPLHATNKSISMESDSTNTTRTTDSAMSRLSLSSISSFGETPPVLEEEEFTEFAGAPDGDALSSVETDTTVSSSGSARPYKTSKSIRRRSRDTSSLSSLGFSSLDREPGTSERSSTEDGPSSVSLAVDKEEEKKASQKSSVLLGANQSPSSPGSWVNSIGKKWEELREGSESTISSSKKLKRASVLLSDVSQSLYSAWGSPPTAAAQQSGLSFTTASSPSTASLSPSMRKAMSQSSRISRAPSSSPSNLSLLDDDEDQQVAIHASVLTPDSLLTPKPVGTPTPPLASSKTTPVSSLAVTGTKKLDDEDDDWNW